MPVNKKCMVSENQLNCREMRNVNDDDHKNNNYNAFSYFLISPKRIKLLKLI